MNSLLHSIQKELKEVNQEIGNYPSPITGCDVQFNDLLKHRSELERKMREMKAKPEITMWQGGNLYLTGKIFLGIQLDGFSPDTDCYKTGSSFSQKLSSSTPSPSAKRLT